MVNQKGSLLVTALAISIVMTLAGGTLLMSVGSALAGEGESLQRTRCLYDAESGLQLGTGWLRRQATPWGVALGRNLLLDMPLDNGCRVTVDLQDTGNPEVKTLTSEAVSGATRVQLTWEARRMVGVTLTDGFPQVWPTKWLDLSD